SPSAMRVRAERTVAWPRVHVLKSRKPMAATRSGKPPPRCTLVRLAPRKARSIGRNASASSPASAHPQRPLKYTAARMVVSTIVAETATPYRSEEHTSELQSLAYLV